MTELYSYNNEITDISSLASLVNLKVLDLSENHVKDVSALSSLTNLTTLDLTNQFICLTGANIGTKTTLPIKSVDGTTPTVKFDTGTGEYKNDELSWSTAGDNKATWSAQNANGELSGTNYQSVDESGLLSPATGDDTQIMLRFL